MWLNGCSTWYLLVALSIITIVESSSGFHCTEEGYHGDPQDCEVYYRCVDFGNGTPLAKYRFVCGPGTVFSKAQGNICTHPSSCGRTECGGTEEVDTEDTSEEVEEPEVPSEPITQPPSRPTKITIAVTQSSVTATTCTTPSPSTSSKGTSETPAPKPAYNDGPQCTCEGFMEDPKDCSKFYRCVRSGEHSYTRHVFTCANGTVWDPKIESCNHAWAAHRVGCKIPTVSTVTPRPSPVTKPTVTVTSVKPTTVKPSPTTCVTPVTTPKPTHSTYPVTKPTVTIGSTKPSSFKPSQGTSAPPVTQPPANGPQCTCEGFMEDPKDCSKFYRCVRSGEHSYTRHVFTCANGTVWDPKIESCNHAWAAHRVGCKVPSISTVTPRPSPVTKPTVTSVKPTTVKPSPTTCSTPVTTPKPTHSTYPVTKPTVTIGSTKPSSVKPSQGTSAPPVTKPPADGPQCTCEGFMEDHKDCSKFYRCVRSGEHSYTRHVFTCANGTVWDPKIESCNHAWAAHRIGCKVPTVSTVTPRPSPVTKPTVTVTTVKPTTVKPSPTTCSTPVTTPKPTHSTYPVTKPTVTIGSTKPSSVKPSQGTSAPPVTQPPVDGPQCTCEGFMEDPKDCSKFYRCVRSGEHSYTRHVFTCANGTVWDPKIESCNHAWAAHRVGCKVPTVSTVTPRPSPVTKPTVTVTSVKPTTVKPIPTTCSTPVTTPKPTHSTYPVTKPTVTIGSTKPSSVKPSQGTSAPPVTQPPVDGPQCTCEGFMEDPKDCSKFYRCVRSGEHSYIRHVFTCANGTVWDPKIESCNHAWAAHRVGCKVPTVSTVTPRPSPVTNPTVTVTSVKPTTVKPSPTTCSTPVTTPKPTHSTYPVTKPTVTIGSTKPSSVKPSQGTSAPPVTKPPADGPQCTCEGFMEDPKDCSKFYRCVRSGEHSYIRHVFTCANGTVWDPKIESCNHAWAAHRVGCKIPTVSTVTPRPSPVTKPTVTTINVKPTTVKPSPTTCSTSVTTPKPTHSTYPVTKPTVTVGSTKPSSVKPSQGTSAPPVTKPPADGPQCTCEGFMEDPKDCSKFYRCVRSGEHSYIRHVFTCANGTVWDPKIESCNHAWAAHRVGCKIPTVSTVTPRPSPVTKPTVTITTVKPTTVKPSPTTCSTPVTTPKPTHSTYPVTKPTVTIGSTKPSSVKPSQGTSAPPVTQPPADGPQCTCEGFMEDPKDCSKFYRCVRSGEHSYTRHVFTCANGTVWDPKIESCNHAWAAHRVGCKVPTISTVTPRPSPVTKPTVTSVKPTTVKPSSTTCVTPVTTPKPTHSTYPVTKPTVTIGSTKPSSAKPSQGTPVTKPPARGPKCTCAGFMADPKNCSKFYRCVKSGNHAYKRSTFTCANGTVWDPKINKCNHAWAAKRVGCKVPNVSISSPTPFPVTKPTVTVTKPKPSSAKPPSGRPRCAREGFMADPQDCKKFYRCVKSGKRTYRRYAFTCGPGTIWDPKINSCNHAWAANRVGCKGPKVTAPTRRPPPITVPTATIPTVKPSSAKPSQGTVVTKPSSGGPRCTCAGFIADPNDCRKYYRCVKSGSHSYKRYKYTCGNRTVWDPKVNRCNHAWAAKRVGCKGPNF